jgi:hypothetical protein
MEYSLGLRLFEAEDRLPSLIEAPVGATSSATDGRLRPDADLSFRITPLTFSRALFMALFRFRVAGHTVRCNTQHEGTTRGPLHETSGETRAVSQKVICPQPLFPGSRGGPSPKAVLRPLPRGVESRENQQVAGWEDGCACVVLRDLTGVILVSCPTLANGRIAPCARPAVGPSTQTSTRPF